MKMKKENEDLMNQFKVEELEQRLEMGWSVGCSAGSGGWECEAKKTF